MNDAYVTSDEMMTCGIVEQHVRFWNKENFADSCEFRGNNFLTLQNINATRCRVECLENKLCNHYTLVNETCYLKSGKVTKSDAVFNNDPLSECGFVEQRLY